MFLRDFHRSEEYSWANQTIIADDDTSQDGRNCSRTNVNFGACNCKTYQDYFFLTGSKTIYKLPTSLGKNSIYLHSELPITLTLNLFPITENVIDYRKTRKKLRLQKPRICLQISAN